MGEPDPLERLLDELAREDVEGLLDEIARADARRLLEEARELARDRVRGRLAGELERRLMEQLAASSSARRPPGRTAPAEGRTAPAEPTERSAATPADEETGQGVYVYAVVDGDAGGALPAGLLGVAGAPVRLVEAGPLLAIASDVPLDQFGDEALRRNLNELPWLSATAVAHEGVVESALAVGALVPMRLCTIFRSDAAVRDMLARERPVLEDALARLRGSSEWGVKVVVERDALAEAVARRSERVRALRQTIDEAGEGAGYLAERQLERLTREEVDAELDARTRSIHETLGALATEARLNPASNRDLAGYTGEMVLNAAYLVPDPRRGELHAQVESLAAEHRDAGLTVELTGPWPPYNFSTMAGAL